MQEIEEHEALQSAVRPRTELIEILSVLWNSKKMIFYVVGTTTVLSIVISLILPEYYRSTASLLPETEKGKIASLGGLSDLAALAGVNVGGESSLAKLYPTIIKSEAVLRNVIYAKYKTEELRDSVNLVEFWEISQNTREREYELALRGLREELEVSLDNKTNVVTISLETREAQLSADILNKVLRELDGFIRTKRTTSASEQRRWVEERLKEVKVDLEKSENRLKDFREKNRRITDSPQLLLEQGRLMREVEINSTLYTELTKQHEIAKIEEIKNIPIISIMDAARPAARKDRPRRSVIVLTTFITSLLGAGFIIFVLQRYEEVLMQWRKIFVSKGKAKVAQVG